MAFMSPPDIKGDGSLVLGVFVHDQLGELLLMACRPDRSETRICLTATASLLGQGFRMERSKERRLPGLADLLLRYPSSPTNKG
jgi:hypothetical protein